VDDSNERSTYKIRSSRDCGYENMSERCFRVLEANSSSEWRKRQSTKMLMRFVEPIVQAG
jgi:hypothetical protein